MPEPYSRSPSSRRRARAVRLAGARPLQTPRAAEHSEPAATVAPVEVGYIIGGVIGVGASALGYGLSSRRDDRIRAEERKAARHAELKQAMRGYLAAVDALTAEMPEDVPPKPPPSRFDSWLLKFANASSLDFVAFIIGRLLQRAMYGNRPNQLLDRLADASAHLRLIATPEVDNFMVEGEALSRAYKPRDVEWLNTWKEYRGRMRTGFREILDQLE